MHECHVQLMQSVFFLNFFRNDQISLPCDYELQALLVQTLYNLRKRSLIMKCLQTSPEWVHIVKFKSASFEKVFLVYFHLCLNAF